MKELRRSNLEPRPARLDPTSWKTPYSMGEAIDGFTRVAVRLLPLSLSLLSLPISFDWTLMDWMRRLNMDGRSTIHSRSCKRQVVSSHFPLLRRIERWIEDGGA